MASALGVSLITLHRYRRKADGGELFIEGRHYRRSTPAARSHWLWHKELAEKAWTQRSRTPSPA